MTLSPIIVAEPFDDRDGDGRILFGPDNRKKYGTSEATYQGTNAAGEHVYWPKGYTPEVAPPPPPPAPAIKAELLNGEAFLQSDTMTVGFNAYGGIGTLYAAPEGFRTDTATGLKRVGLFRPPLDDAILQGRAIEGFIIEASGKRAANMQLTGLTQIPGSFTDPTRWQGAFNGLHIDQAVTLDGDRLGFAMTLTNRSGKTITGLRYARAFDPDQSDKYATTNKVPAAGTIECTLDGGGKITLRTDDVRASVSVAAYNTASIIGPTRAVGQSKTADEVMQLVFALGELANGAAVTLQFELALKP
ncbi:MAG: hypothetical protein ACK4YT_00695 [Sphingomonas sp.]